MPSNAMKLLGNVPWREITQAAVTLLMLQLRPFSIASPLACAWLCAAAGSDSAWPRWMGVCIGALLCGGEGAWALPLLSLILLLAWAARRLDPPEVEGALMLSGCLCILEAAAHSGLDTARAPEWLLCGLMAAALGVPVCAMRPQRRHLRRAAVNVGMAEGAGTLQAPPREKRQPLKLPARQRDQLAYLGRLSVALGAVSGAALAFGGAAGAMVAAVLLVQWRDDAGDMPALMMCGALAACGVPVENASAPVALHLTMRLLSRYGRPLQILGGLASSGAWLLLGGSAQGIAYLAALAPGAASVYLLPQRRSPAQAAYDDQARWNRLQRRTEDQLNHLADAVSELAQGQASGLDPPREEALLVSLRARLCEGCVRYERCWNGRAGEGLRLLCELITKSVNGTLPEQVLPDMMRRCMRANIIPTRLYADLNRFAQMRGAHIARMDGAQRASLSIDTVTKLLRSAAQEQRADLAAADLRQAEAELRCGGIWDASLTLSPDGLVLTRPRGWPDEDCERARQICTKHLGGRYICAYCDGRALCLRPAPAILARAGWDGAAVSGGSSGDSVYIGALDDRRQVVIISDGMGTGEGAAGVSRRAVRAVRKFLRAGIAPERAALLANQLLMSQSCGETFATLDLCVIDNWRREAVWVKMAAWDSYLLREHDCSVIPGGYLPMGILAEAKPQVSVQPLLPGDVIVMGTDGAMEGLDSEAALQCVIPRRNADATRLARCMRQAVREKCAHADDQTLAVICIERAEDAKERAMG